VQPVSDALVVSTYTDAALMVVRADQTRSGLIQLSLAKLVNAHARVVGVVLNDLDLKLAERYYGNFGYYRYYAENTDKE
jgi:Mrp family chromosome partitioning ATPase